MTANPGIDETKANFFSRHGEVVSGAVTLTVGDQPETLLELPGASVVVTASVNSAGTIDLALHNATAASLQAVQDLDGTVTASPLNPRSGSTIQLPSHQSGSHRLHLQILPSGPAFPNVVSLLVSTDQARDTSVVAQAFAGAV
jgi:hypothetical protein